MSDVGVSSDEGRLSMTEVPGNTEKVSRIGVGDKNRGSAIIGELRRFPTGRGQELSGFSGDVV